ncbi:hypothetical protein FQN55_000705 [Onygenales sp. PD_40]|nr:hypothetical protein FQN55_000705 [Onygenales sp. PD_40]KAK2789139.1 hypothetical protein FQN53_002363 [Emmonsiellopsis sp. PD_33]
MTIPPAMVSEVPLDALAGDVLDQHDFRPIDEAQYQEVVLQIPGGQTEEEVEKRLINEARQIGLESSDAIHPQFSIARYVDPFPTPSSSRFNPDTLPSTSTNPSFAHQKTTSSPPTISSSNELRSSMHSAASLSTRPTSHGSNDGSFKATIPSQAPRSRYFHHSNISSSRNWPISRERRATLTQLKQAFGKFPHFRRRSNVSASIIVPSSPASPETRSTTPGADNRKSHDIQAHSGNMTPLPDNSTSNVDSEAIMKSFNCAQIQQLRSVHQAQRDRFLAFKTKTLESLCNRHNEVKARRKSEYEEIEKNINEQNIQEASRLEEIQLNAELDLVDDLQRERQRLEICIRHMEGYFNTPSPFSPTDDAKASPQAQHQRQFTQKERNHLQQKYRERDQMDTLHASRIKVLRDIQERKYLEVMSKLEKNASETAQANGKSFQDLVGRCNDETTAVNMWFIDRQQHLLARWMLEEAIVRKNLETDTGISYAPLPLLSFLEQ